MALTGIQIYKLLPQTNCKECGFPTCLAFAMKLAAKQVELSACPYVTPESKAQLAESAAPPIRLISLKSDGYEVKAGNEVVLYRHEKTFYNRPGLLIKFNDSLDPETLSAQVKLASAYAVNYVGIELSLDGFAVESTTGDPARFASAVKAVRQVTKKPLILMSQDPAVLSAGLQPLAGENPLLFAADANNWEAMADLAKSSGASLVVSASSLDALADLTEKIKSKGLENLVLHPITPNLGEELVVNTQIRRLAVKKNFRSLGFPTLALPKTPAAAARRLRNTLASLSWINFHLSWFIHCWSCGKIFTPIHKNRSRFSLACTRLTVPSQKILCWSQPISPSPISAWLMK
jgi:acetyl-CoA decarbonylase/synthase complex subunit gamma